MMTVTVALATSLFINCNEHGALFEFFQSTRSVPKSVPLHPAAINVSFLVFFLISLAFLARAQFFILKCWGN